MRKILFQHSVRWTLAAVCLGAMISNTTAGGGGFTRGCAARDMQVLMLIEERESANAISAQQSTDAMLAMMHARNVCYEGYVVDALAIYDKITQSITTGPVTYGRRP